MRKFTRALSLIYLILEKYEFFILNVEILTKLVDLNLNQDVFIYSLGTLISRDFFKKSCL